MHKRKVRNSDPPKKGKAGTCANKKGKARGEAEEIFMSGGAKRKARARACDQQDL
jgi:hypothetical protein